MSTELEDIKQRLKDDVPWIDIGRMRMDALKQLDLLEKALRWAIGARVYMYRNRMNGVIHISDGGCGCCSGTVYSSNDPTGMYDESDFPVEFRELILSLADSGEFDD